MTAPHSTKSMFGNNSHPRPDSANSSGSNLASSAAADPRTGGSPAIVRPLGTLLWRSLRLRCPVCGEGRLFRGWFRMYERCEHCRFRFERSPGYWLGSIFVNYGLTALIVTGAYFAMFFTDALPQEWTLRILLAFCVLFPLCFFRYARSIWIGVDLYFDPEPAAETAASKPTDARF